MGVYHPVRHVLSYLCMVAQSTGLLYGSIGYLHHLWIFIHKTVYPFLPFCPWPCIGTVTHWCMGGDSGNADNYAFPAGICRSLVDGWIRYYLRLSGPGTRHKIGITFHPQEIRHQGGTDPFCCFASFYGRGSVGGISIHRIGYDVYDRCRYRCRLARLRTCPRQAQRPIQNQHRFFYRERHYQCRPHGYNATRYLCEVSLDMESRLSEDWRCFQRHAQSLFAQFKRTNKEPNLAFNGSKNTFDFI